MTTPINQHAIVIDALKTGPKSTLDFRYQYGVLEAPARICELKDLGFVFHKETIEQADVFGYMHKNIARYTLLADSPQRRLF